MSTVMVEREVAKLAHELSVDPADLAFLGTSTVATVRALRQAASTALYARSEARVRNIAALTKMVPQAIAAKIAEMAMGPVLSARVAGALDPAEAAKLTGHLSPEFVANVSRGLDPTRVAAIIAGLPEDLIVKVGRTLMAAGDHLTLARFIAVVQPEVALRVVEGSSGAALLDLSLYVDEQEALNPVMAKLPEATIREIVEAAGLADDPGVLAAMVEPLSPENRQRLLEQVDVLPDDQRDGLRAAVENING